MSYDTILAKSPSIIFQPGGTPGENLVVTTWAEVQAFVALRQGAVVVYVDDSLAACHVPAASGVTDFQGRGEIRPYRQDAQNYSTLTIDAGATLKSLSKISGTVFLECNPTTATPSLDFDYTPNVVGTPFPEFFIEDWAAIGTPATATTPACIVPANAQLNVIMQNFATIAAESASAIFQLAAASSILLFQARYSVFQSAISFIPPTWVQGPGTFEMSFDAGTANFTNLPGTVIGPGVNFTNAGTTKLIALEGDTSTYAGADTPTGISTQTVFVRANGSDTFNNGSRDFPYASIQKALSAITDASTSKRYIVDVGPGEYAGAFNFKPWVAIQGHPSSSGFAGTTEITAAAGAIGLDPLFATSGFSVLWASHLVFSNQLTLNYSALANNLIQGTFFDCDFNGGGGVGFQFIGSGTGGVDNWTLDNCIIYGGGLAQGVQFLFTIGGTQFLGGTVTIQAAPSATAAESTTWLAQNTAVGSAFSPTNVHVLWAAPTPAGFSAKLDWCNSNCVGQINLDGASTVANISGLRPADVIQSNGAAPAVVQPLSIEMSFTTAGPTHNILGALQAAGTIPTTGTIRIDIEGFGGTGGGGGGQGGPPLSGGASGVGGGGSGGVMYQIGSFDFNLSHQLDIDVGTAGSGGTGGAAGNVAGLNGVDGEFSWAFDHTSSTNLFVMNGTSGGQGGGASGGGPGRGGASYPGQAYVPNISDVAGPPYGSGFPLAGGKGGLAGVSGSNGQNGYISQLVPGLTGSWAGALGGPALVTEGGGGGGGGQGIFGPAGTGGPATPAGNPGGNGNPPLPGSGGGAGGGAGGTGPGDVGGNGGGGSIGFVKVRLVVQ